MPPSEIPASLMRSVQDWRVLDKRALGSLLVAKPQRTLKSRAAVHMGQADRRARAGVRKGRGCTYCSARVIHASVAYARAARAEDTERRASQEEALAAFVPGYQVSFRGSMLAVDEATGAILWKDVLAPPGYTGNAVWGSSPAIDTKRGQVYIATGNNYSVPQSVLDCVSANAGNPDAIAACSDPSNHFDSIMALNMRTGAMRWVTRALPFDAWTVDCFFPPPFDENCPDPQGPDYDFGQAPALYKTKDSTGKTIELVGAGQKSGEYWALDPDSGEVKWVTQAGQAEPQAACSGARRSTEHGSTRPMPTVSTPSGRRRMVR
jgi:hypothetical protein